MKDKLIKLSNDITKNVNEILEDVDCKITDDKQIIFTVKQIKKYNERIIKAVLKSIKGYL